MQLNNAPKLSGFLPLPQGWAKKQANDETKRLIASVVNPNPNCNSCLVSDDIECTAQTVLFSSLNGHGFSQPGSHLDRVLAEPFNRRSRLKRRCVEDAVNDIIRQGGTGEVNSLTADFYRPWRSMRALPKAYNNQNHAQEFSQVSHVCYGNHNNKSSQSFCAHPFAMIDRPDYSEYSQNAGTLQSSSQHIPTMEHKYPYSRSHQSNESTHDSVSYNNQNPRIQRRGNCSGGFRRNVNHNYQKYTPTNFSSRTHDFNQNRIIDNENYLQTPMQQPDCPNYWLHPDYNCEDTLSHEPSAHPSMCVNYEASAPLALVPHRQQLRSFSLTPYEISKYTHSPRLPRACLENRVLLENCDNSSNTRSGIQHQVLSRNLEDSTYYPHKTELKALEINEVSVDSFIEELTNNWAPIIPLQSSSKMHDSSRNNFQTPRKKNLYLEQDRMITVKSEDVYHQSSDHIVNRIADKCIQVSMKAMTFECGIQCDRLPTCSRCKRLDVEEGIKTVETCSSAAKVPRFKPQFATSTPISNIIVGGKSGSVSSTNSFLSGDFEPLPCQSSKLPSAQRSSGNTSKVHIFSAFRNALCETAKVKSAHTEMGPPGRNED